MISNWKYDYSNEEKGLALTILNLNEEIKKLVDEAEEQDRHIKEANIEIERLREENILLRASEPMSKLQEDYGYKAEVERLNNIINELENGDDVLEEFEDWLERQKTRNSEWDNFIMVDGRLGIPISYLLNKLQELKGSESDE